MSETKKYIGVQYEVGRRDNEGKAELSYIDEYFFNAISELAKVCSVGAIKYSRSNCLKGGSALTFNKLYDSARRHMGKFMQGKDFDDFEDDGSPGTHRHHLAHAAWNILLMLEFYYTMPEQDDRNKKIEN